jgi:hypothetical protein
VARPRDKNLNDHVLVVLAMSRAHVLTLANDGWHRRAAHASGRGSEEPRPSAAYR